MRVRAVVPESPRPGGKPPDSPLTPRQQEVAYLLAEGHTVSGVAIRLKVSIHTVRDHIKAAGRALPGDAPALRKVVLWAARNRPHHI